MAIIFMESERRRMSMGLNSVVYMSCIYLMLCIVLE